MSHKELQHLDMFTESPVQARRRLRADKKSKRGGGGETRSPVPGLPETPSPKPSPKPRKPVKPAPKKPEPEKPGTPAPKVPEPSKTDPAITIEGSGGGRLLASVYAIVFRKR